MKRRALSNLVVLATLTWGATRSFAETLLVTENTKNDVVKIVGTTTGVVTTFATANMTAPLGITTDALGNVYVVNNNQATSSNINSVAMFSSTGAPVGSGYFTPPNSTTPPPFLNAPIDIAFTGTHAYVTNLETSHVGMTDPMNPGSVGQFLPNGPNAMFQGTFTINSIGAPYGIGVNPTNGFVYVVNSGSNTVTAYDPNAVPNSGGRPVAIGPFGSTELNVPLGIAFDSKGNVYVSSFGSNSNNFEETIKEFSTTGRSFS